MSFLEEVDFKLIDLSRNIFIFLIELFNEFFLILLWVYLVGISQKSAIELCHLSASDICVIGKDLLHCLFFIFAEKVEVKGFN